MAVIQWNQIKPDFSSSSRSMQNAMSGLSSAGTVFEKMREGILAEEQRAIENARAADAAALAQAELDERIRANQADEAQAAATLAEQMRHAKATEAVAAAGLRLQQDEAARIRANDKAGRLAADQLYEMQHGHKNVNGLLASWQAAEAMTPEMFEEAKLSGGMINPDTKQAYTNLDEYRKAAKGAYDKASTDFHNKHPKLGSAGFEDLSTSTGLERQFEILYRNNGGSGLGTAYLPSYISRGVATESELAKADAAAKVEAAKNARLSEVEYGSWDKMQGILTKSGFGAVDAQAISSTILGVQRALKSAGMNVSNKEVFNRIMETASLPNDKKGIIGKGWDWLWGGDRASLGKYGMNNAVGDFTKLWSSSAPTGTKTVPGPSSKAPVTIEDLLSAPQKQAVENSVTTWVNQQHDLFNKDVSDEEIATYRADVVKRLADEAGLNLAMPNLATAVIRDTFSDEELKAAGIKKGKKFTGITQLQFNTLMNNRGIKDPSIFLIPGYNTIGWNPM